MGWFDWADVGDYFDDISDIGESALGSLDDQWEGLLEMLGGSTVAMPPDEIPEAITDLESELETVTARANSILEQFQVSMADIMSTISEATIPTAPEIIEIEDVNWTEKIAEMELAATADIAEITYWGEASGTRLTSSEVWEREADVVTRTLGGS